MLQKIWYGNLWVKWLLWPFSLIYQSIAIIRSHLYRLGFYKSVSFNVPVIVVGNITVGGTGKTPFCIALCDFLKKQGHKPGLVSRGYGGKATHWPQRVTALSDPALVGDEPVLLVRRTSCPMVVAPDRVAAVQQLLAETDCTIVVSDDGLQHHRLARDIEIVLLDTKRGLGNGLCLPAGPLREPVKRLNTVDVVVDSSQYSIAVTPVCSLLNPKKMIVPDDVKGRRVCALAGIGNPDRFFDALSTLGFVFERKIFKDHYAYQKSDLLAITADLIIMTEKDAVKCQAFCDERCYMLPITMVFNDDLSHTLGQLLDA